MTFKDDMLADNAVFYNTDEFAVAGIYSPADYAAVHPSSKSRTVNGIFTEAHKSVLDGESYPASFNCPTAEVSDASDGAKLTVNDVVYTVRNTPADGSGETTLVLEKVTL